MSAYNVILLVKIALIVLLAHVLYAIQVFSYRTIQPVFQLVVPDISLMQVFANSVRRLVLTVRQPLLNAQHGNT